jgi:hypothetical protein
VSIGASLAAVVQNIVDAFRTRPEADPSDASQTEEKPQQRRLAVADLVLGEHRGGASQLAAHTDVDAGKNLPGSDADSDEPGEFFRSDTNKRRFARLADVRTARSDVERLEVSNSRGRAPSHATLRHIEPSPQAAKTPSGQEFRAKAASAADLAREVHFKRNEYGTSARAVVDVGGREVALKMRHHRGLMTVEIEASAQELAQKLVQRVGELSRSLQALDVGRGRVQIGDAIVGEWSNSDHDDHDRERGHRGVSRRREHTDDELAIDEIRHAAITGTLHIVT